MLGRNSNLSIHCVIKNASNQCIGKKSYTVHSILIGFAADDNAQLPDDGGGSSSNVRGPMGFAGAVGGGATGILGSMGSLTNTLTGITNEEPLITLNNIKPGSRPSTPLLSTENQPASPKPGSRPNTPVPSTSKEPTGQCVQNVRKSRISSINLKKHQMFQANFLL